MDDATSSAISENSAVNSSEMSVDSEPIKNAVLTSSDAEHTATTEKTKDGKEEVFTVHVAIQACDYDIERGNSCLPSRRRTLPSRFRDYEDPEEVDNRDYDEDYEPPVKTSTTGRGRGRPRKVPVETVNISDKDTLQGSEPDSISGEAATQNSVSTAMNSIDKLKPRKGPRLKYEKFSENELRTERPYRCVEDECGQTFTSANWLCRHVELKHHDSKPVIKMEASCTTDETISKKSYSCPTCSRSFTQEGNMKSHQRIHSGEKKYYCDMCPNRFLTAESLKRHKMSHLGIKPYDCDICSAKFASNVALKEHKHIHRDIKEHTCHLCQRQFRQVSVYQRHLLTHSAERRFKCDLCDKRFTQKIYLRSHMKKHTGERTYKCDLCEKRFAHASDKTRHQKIHSGEKPYSCDVCQARFTDPSSCRRHMKEHTGDMPYPCQNCGERFKRKIALRTHLNRCHIPDILRQELLQQGVYIPGANADDNNVNIHVTDDHNLVLLGAEGQEIPIMTQVLYTKDNQRVIKIVEDNTQKNNQEVLVSPDAVPPGEQIDVVKADDDISSGDLQQGEPLSAATQQIIQQIESQLGMQESALGGVEGQQVQVAYHVLHDDENQQIVEIQYEPVEQTNDDYVVIASGDQPIPDQATTDGIAAAKALAETEIMNQMDETENAETDLKEVSFPIKLESHGHEYAQSVEAEPVVKILHEQTSASQSNSSESLMQVDESLVSSSHVEIIAIDQSMLDKQVVENILPQSDESLSMDPKINNKELTNQLRENTPSELQIISPEMVQPNASRFAAEFDLSQQIFTSDLTRRYIEKPDFTSQEYYNWLSNFTDNSKQAAVPLSDSVYKNISQLNKTLTDIMASPIGILAHKENFKILMTISYDLHTIISKHLMCVLLTLEKEDDNL